jgi:putative DNA primase/helicase
MNNMDSKNGFEHISEPARRVIENIPPLRVPDGIPAEHPQKGKPSQRHVYTDEAGNPTVVVYRFDNSDNSDNRRKKEFRPYTLSSRDWKAPDVRPLYRLDALSRYDGPVVLVEGEKCADALNDMGILATTAFGGCNGIKKTDLSPLRGRDVIIWPDNDEPGRKYADNALRRLQEIGVGEIRTIPIDDEFLRSVYVAGNSTENPIRNQIV